MAAMFEEDPEIVRDMGLRVMLSSLPLIRHSSGELICEAGSMRRSIYFIVEGSAICKDRGTILARRFTGEVLGEVFFYRVGNRGASCDVFAGHHGCSVREIPAHEMDAWRLEDPLKAARINRRAPLRPALEGAGCACAHRGHARRGMAGAALRATCACCAGSSRARWRCA